MKLDYHEAANLFPLMEGKDYEAFKADIAEHGQRDPVWLYEGKILDGRNRYRALAELDKPCETREWEGEGSPVAFVVSVNLHRRHLSESQRGMIAEKIATAPHGGAVYSPSPTEVQIKTSVVTRDEAAALLNVSKATLAVARAVRKHGVPELAEAVEDGSMSLHAASVLKNEPPEKQREAARAAKNGETHDHKPKRKASEIPTRTKTHKGRKAPEAIRGAIGTLVGLATGLDSFKVVDAAPTPDEAEEWEKELALVISAINRFRRQLKEIGHV